jgi:phosphopantetheinyl transferase (holo-ACP synthase)
MAARIGAVRAALSITHTSALAMASVVLEDG